MFDILSVVSGKKKHTQSGWTSFNAVCCIHNGESQDKRGRGGIKTQGSDWSYHCFNCGFKASFKLGRNLTFKARRLLSWFGVDNNTIQQINLESLKHKNIEQLVQDRSEQKPKHKIKFDSRELPEGARLIGSSDKEYVDYLVQRQLSTDYPYMITPEETGRQARRIIVPYTHDGEIVGYTSRYMDSRAPKFISEQQPDYVFGMDLQQPDWSFVIVTEGIFDALSLNALGVLHNTVSDGQKQLIESLNRPIVVVPDQDKTGLQLIDKAMEFGWGCSIPDWPDNVKDINDCVVRYGRIATLISIVNATETSNIKIELRKRKLKHGLLGSR